MAKFNNSIHMDVEAMNNLVTETTALVNAVADNSVKYEQLYKRLTDDTDMFQAAGNGANLVDAYRDTSDSTHKLIQELTEKLGQFAANVSKMASDLNAATGAASKQVNELADAVKAAKTKVANATAKDA